MNLGPAERDAGGDLGPRQLGHVAKQAYAQELPARARADLNADSPRRIRCAQAAHRVVYCPRANQRRAQIPAIREGSAVNQPGPDPVRRGREQVIHGVL